jgi:polysaccharide export outer membrane protein
MPCAEYTRHGPVTFMVSAALLLCACFATNARAQASQADGVSSEQPASAEESGATLGRRRVLGGADANYRIGAGDMIDIRVLGEDQMSATSRVSNSGYIQVPFVGEDIRAQCLTERQLSAIVEQRLKKFLKYPEVHVSVKEFNGSPVAIIGAVSSPGRFQMQRQVNLLELLVLAGGVSAQAGRVLHVIHSGATDPCDTSEGPAPPVDVETASETLSLSKLMNGDVSANPVMRPGDIVIVPNADVVFIAGEVLKPNAYPLREGLTLGQLLALAGGITNLAKADAVKIVRQEPGKPKQELAVNLKDIQKNKAADPLLAPNDIVEVPSSTGKKVLISFLSTIGGSIGQLPVRVVP